MSPQLPAPRSDLGRTYRLLIMLAALFVTVVFVFPLVLTPGVEPLTSFPFGNALSMAVRISNPNPFTPLTDVEYSCDIWNVTLASGTEVKNANILIRGTRQKFDGRQAITARCETAYIVNAPIQAAEYRLTLTYRTFPWPEYRKNVYHIAAQVDGNGRVTGWALN